jgi:hypothetical protein
MVKEEPSDDRQAVRSLRKNGAKMSLKEWWRRRVSSRQSELPSTDNEEPLTVDLEDLNGGELETARTGYQAAITLWAYEGSLIWSKFTAMVYVNTFIVLAISVIISVKPVLKSASIALAAIGVILCTAWLAIMRRSFFYHDYWVASARGLEQLLKPLKTVSQGKLLSEGRKIDLGDGRVVSEPRFKIKSISRGVIYVFIAVYIGFIVFVSVSNL